MSPSETRSFSRLTSRIWTFDHLADGDHLAGVVDAAPAHVGDVEQAVHAGLRSTKTPKSVMFLTMALDVVADLDGLEEGGALLGALGLDDLAAGEDDVLAVVVDLDDLELVDVAEVFVEVLGRDDVDLGAGEEGLHADVDHEAALDDALDLAFDESALVEDLDDLVPVLFVGGFLFGEDNHPLLVLEFLEEDFDVVAHLDVFVFKFCARNGTFGFISDIYQHDLWLDFKDAPVDDRPLAELAERLVDQGRNAVSLTHNTVVKLGCLVN